MALNLDRIAENERKITKLDDVIKRTTAKKKKECSPDVYVAL